MGRVKVTLDGYQCERCRHTWVPRMKDYPRICPKCKSAYWDRPRKKRAKNEEGK